jgi:hypothetical protein
MKFEEEPQYLLPRCIFRIIFGKLQKGIEGKKI